MSHHLKTILLLSLICCFSNVSVAQSNDNPVKKKAVCDMDQRFNRIFARDCCGVTGADGEYSVLLPDGRTVWIFGDSFLGTVNADRSREKRSPWFIRNSMAIQEGDSLLSLYQVLDGWESSLVIPPGAPKGSQFSEDSLWYWPGDGFIENGKLQAFMTGFYQATPGNWGFKWESANVATFSLPDFKLEGIHRFDYPVDTEVHWGHAVCDDDPDYTYIYGASDKDKHVYVARAPRSNILAPWEFYNGSDWVSDSRQSKPTLKIPGSEQFSVFKLQGKYVLFVQEGGFMTGEICTYISDYPYKGWRNRKVICHTRLPENVTSTKNLFAYNSVAHPQFIENGELLISTCINSFEVEDVFQDASKYRPVFQRVPIERIFEE